MYLFCKIFQPSWLQSARVKVNTFLHFLFAIWIWEDYCMLVFIWKRGSSLHWNKTELILLTYKKGVIHVKSFSRILNNKLYVYDFRCTSSHPITPSHPSTRNQEISFYHHYSPSSIHSPIHLLLALPVLWPFASN